MELSGTPADVALLKRFSPLDGMKAENVIALARKTSRRQAPKGRVLFREDDTEKQTYFLLSGTVDLLQEGEIIATIAGGTPHAKNPIGHFIPRRQSAVATSNIEYLLIDSEFLDVVVTWDQTGSYKVAELKGAQDDVQPSPAHRLH